MYTGQILLLSHTDGVREELVWGMRNVSELPILSNSKATECAIEITKGAKRLKPVGQVPAKDPAGVQTDDREIPMQPFAALMEPWAMKITVKERQISPEWICYSTSDTTSCAEMTVYYHR